MYQLALQPSSTLVLLPGQNSVQDLFTICIICLEVSTDSVLNPVCSVPMETDNYYLNKGMQKKTT